MERAAPGYNSQKIKPQKRNESGRAMTKPHPKLPSACSGSEWDSDSASGNMSTGFIMLALAVSDLLLWAGQVRPAAGQLDRAFARIVEKIRPLGEWIDDGLEGLAAIADAGADLAVLAGLAIGKRAEFEEAIQRAIILGSGRKGGKLGKSYHAAAMILFYLVYLATPRLAFAQEVKVLTPVEMFDPASGPGLAVGPSFVLRPLLTARGVYDTNIYNVDTAKTNDIIGIIKPSLTLQSDFPRHALALHGDAEIRRYVKTTAEDSEAFNLTASGKLELGSGIDVEPDVGYARAIEQRGTAGDQFVTDRPVDYHEVQANLRISRARAKLALLVEANWTHAEYDPSTSNGVPIDNTDRNVEVLKGRVNAALRLTDRTRFFLELGGNKVHYLVPTPVSRDSKGYAVLGGIHLQITSLVDLEAALGYIQQNFDDPTIRTVRGLNYRLTGNWTPTPRWRITAGAERTIDRSPRLDTPAIVRSKFSLEAQNALGRRLLLDGQVAYVREHYWGIDRIDKRFETNFSVEYRLTKHIGLTGGAGYRKQAGGSIGRSYEGASASVGVRIVW